MLPYHPTAGVGSHPDQILDMRQGIVELAATARYPLPQPHSGKTDGIGSKENELFLDDDAALEVHLQRVHLEDDVRFLDASVVWRPL